MVDKKYDLYTMLIYCLKHDEKTSENRDGSYKLN